MQILPLVTTRSTTTANGGVSQEASSRQSALFASLLESAQSTSTTPVAAVSSASTGTLVDSGTQTTVSAGAGKEDLRNLRMTQEDLAALHDELKEQGFSDDELSAMEDRINSESGMTWGEMMDAVEEKIAKTKQTEKKEISNADTVQLLGLFGKLGFSANESQKMVDSLASGETESVWSKVGEKLSGLSADSTVTISASEMTALARAMDLSDEAQARLTALFDNAGSDSKELSGQGLATAFNLVKNELLAKVGQENQALADFRKAASAVLDEAWLRESGKLNAGLHTDDVARKAAQVAAMSGEKHGKTADVPTADKPGLDVLADVPETGAAADSQVEDDTDVKADTSGKSAGETLSAQRNAAKVAARQAVAGERQGLAEQTSDRTSEQTSRTDQTATTDQSRSGTTAKTVSEAFLADKTVARATADRQGATDASRTASADKTAGTAQQLAGGQTDAGSAGQQQGEGSGGFLGQSGSGSGWAEFWSKVRSEKTTGESGELSRLAAATARTQTGQGTQTMAAMDAVTGSLAGKTAAKTFDPTLASRAARQLETGILRNLGQNSKQLTLDLSPDELGKLSVTLTVRDKEVRAVIAADKADTAAMLHEQAAKIKQTLEDQGFKVTKLEVQTGIARDNQGSWQSPEQHNAARDQQREALDRMRSTRLLRGTGLDAETGQSGFVPASTMTRAEGLDLFA